MEAYRIEKLCIKLNSSLLLTHSSYEKLNDEILKGKFKLVNKRYKVKSTLFRGLYKYVGTHNGYNKIYTINPKTEIHNHIVALASYRTINLLNEKYSLYSHNKFEIQMSQSNKIQNLSQMIEFFSLLFRSSKRRRPKLPHHRRV